MNPSKGKSIFAKIGKLALGDSYPTRIMGVINLTSDSFYSRSVRKSPKAIRAQAIRMEEDGADILDLGARSTAPYKKFDISSETEERILSEAIKEVRSVVGLPLSADTTRLGPAKAAAKEGASVLNNVYGLIGRDSKKTAELIRSKDLGLILTAHEGKPPRRGASPIQRVFNSLTDRLDFCIEQGVQRESIIVDPGIGFFADDKISAVDWNCDVLANLEVLRSLGLPVGVGASRKRFLGKLIGDKHPEARLNASLAATAVSVYNGAHLIRTHDVKETREAAIIAKSLREKRFIR
jgi:dihydropteroate synthase